MMMYADFWKFLEAFEGAKGWADKSGYLHYLVRDKEFGHRAQRFEFRFKVLVELLEDIRKADRPESFLLDMLGNLITAVLNDATETVRALSNPSAPSTSVMVVVEYLRCRDVYAYAQLYKEPQARAVKAFLELCKCLWRKSPRPELCPYLAWVDAAVVTQNFELLNNVDTPEVMSSLWKNALVGIMEMFKVGLIPRPDHLTISYLLMDEHEGVIKGASINCGDTSRRMKGLVLHLARIGRFDQAELPMIT